MISQDPEGDAWTAELKAIRSELAAHPGTVAHQRSLAVRRAHGILVMNEHDLSQLLDAPDSDPDLVVELFQNVREPVVRDAFIQDLIRRLHNYVAAVKTLVDHTRRIMRAEADAAFKSEYEQRIAAMAAAPVVGFVQKLRYYFLHYGVPPFTQRVHPGRSADHGHAFEVLLSPADLLLWPDWSAGAKSYLRASTSEFDLRVPIREYNKLVESLYAWFYDAHWQVHRGSIEGADQVIARYNRVLVSLAGDPDTELTD